MYLLTTAGVYTTSTAVLRQTPRKPDQLDGFGVVGGVHDHLSLLHIGDLPLKIRGDVDRRDGVLVAEV